MADRRFSPSAAWDDVRATLAAHRQLLIALAGAFFLLPQLALSFFGPANALMTLGENPSAEQAMAAFRPLVPWLLAFVLVQMAGQLAILAAILRRGSGTVADAVRVGLSRLGYLILVNIVFLLLALAVMVLAVLFFGLLAALAGALAPALGVVGALVVMGLYLFLFVRFLLPTVLLVTEDEKWPLPVLSRSWRLTGGNALPIFVFYLIVTIVFFVIILAVSLIGGTVLALLGLDIAPGGSGAAILAVINGIVSTGGTVVFLLMQLSVYRQLAGSSPERSR